MQEAHLRSETPLRARYHTDDIGIEETAHSKKRHGLTPEELRRLCRNNTDDRVAEEEAAKELNS